MFRPTQKMGPDGPKWGQEDFFLLIQTLPTFWAERILILRIFIFWIFWGPKFLAWAHLGPTWAHPLWAPRGPTHFGPHVGPPTWAPRGPTHWGPTWAHPLWAQTPPPAPPDEFSDPNLTPLPTHPGIKYVARTLAAILLCGQTGSRCSGRHNAANNAGGTHTYIFLANSRRFFTFLRIFGHFMALFVVRRGFKMILSHMAPSSLNMSSYRAIWTHFRQNSTVYFLTKKSQIPKNPNFS